jgi:hypothetical protein
MKRNWIKMYNKEGSVLRVETSVALSQGYARHEVFSDAALCPRSI